MTFTCTGCHEQSGRAALCGFCRAAIAEMPPDKKLDSNDTLREMRGITERWVTHGLNRSESDRLVILTHRLDKYLTHGGWYPDDWDSELPPPDPTRTRAIEDVRSALLGSTESNGAQFSTVCPENLSRAASGTARQQSGYPQK